MEPTLTAAIITAVATIVGTVVGAYVTAKYTAKYNENNRTHVDSNLLGVWGGIGDRCNLWQYGQSGCSQNTTEIVKPYFCFTAEPCPQINAEWHQVEMVRLETHYHASFIDSLEHRYAQQMEDRFQRFVDEMEAKEKTY